MTTRDLSTTTAFERWELPNVGPKVAAGQHVPTGTLTAAQVEAVQTQAYEEAARDGHKEGFAKGHEAGVQAARAEMSTQVARLESFLTYLCEPVAQVDEEIEQQLLLLAMTVARELIGHELKTDAARVAAGVRGAVEALGAVEREVRVVVHPDDHRLLRSGDNESDMEPGWQFIEDASVTPGGCRVLCGSSVVDATLERRLAEIVGAVLSG